MKISVRNSGKIIRGRLRLVASKSESNRMLIIKAVSGLPLRIENLSESGDTQTLQDILATEHMRSSVEHTLQHDVGPAGTTMRFLTALFACRPGNYVITGSQRMKSRPIHHLVDALRQLGAEINYLETEGYPPLKIRGQQLKGGEVNINGSVSSQFTSALMMVAPLLQNGLILNFHNGLVSRSYVKMTAELMKRYGVNVEMGGMQIIVPPGHYSIFNDADKNYRVEGDWSSASYLYAFAALSEQSEIVAEGLRAESAQPDSVCANIFEQFGVHSHFTADGVVITKVSSKVPEHFTYDFSECPDIAQTLAVVCAAKKIPAELRGLTTLRVKETDRLAALQNELLKFNVHTETEDNSVLRISPEHADFSKSVEIETYEDHRMAMSFAALALVSPSIVIQHPAVVQKSYPSFWDDLKQLGFELTA